MDVQKERKVHFLLYLNIGRKKLAACLLHNIDIRDRPIWLFCGRYRYIGHTWADSRCWYFQNFKSCFPLISSI